MMQMTILAKFLRTFAVLTGIAAAGLSTTAQAQTTACGVTGSASATPAVYDPFNPSGLTNTNVTVTLRRVNNTGGGDTRIVNFYLKPNASTGTAVDGASIVPLSVTGSAALDGGQGMNIFYNSTGPFPTLPLNPIGTLPTGGNRYAQINFTGNNAASDTAQVTFQVSLPPNLNLNAANTLAFDAVFTCNIQGGQSNGVVGSGEFPNAVVFPVTVLSALRTYYAGTALDFGEIGAIPAVPLSPVRTSPSNYIFVQSSGAYSVQLSSQNAFKLKKPGAASINDEIRYSLRFLGLTRDNGTSPTQGSTELMRTCTIAGGPTTAGQQLPIQATLVDGGANKSPSPSYSDILTVTITPLAYNVVGTSNCGSFSVP
jgi:hypothetical protein